MHGQAGLDMALKTTNILYQQDLNTLAKLSLDEARLVHNFSWICAHYLLSNTCREIFSGAHFLQRLFSPGLTVLEMAVKIGCFRTEKDAIRIIRAGGFRLVIFP